MKRKLINIKPIERQLMDAVTEKTKNILSISGDTVNISVSVKDLIDKYLEEKNVVEPRIYITTTAYTKLRILVNRYEKEIGMYGTVDHILNTTVTPNIDCYIITDILVYPQTTTGATCNQDEDRMWEFEMSLTDEQVNTRRFHIHSHVNMSTGPSSVDEDFYQRLMTQCADYYIVAITNKRNEYFVRFYDVNNNIIYEDLPIYIIKENGESLDDWYTNVIKDNIVEQTYNYLNKTDKSSKVPEQKSGYFARDPWGDLDEDEDELWWKEHENYITASNAAKHYEKKYGKRGRPRKDR